jgi:hypothetical protein
VLKAADVAEFAIMDNLGSHKGRTRPKTLYRFRRRWLSPFRRWCLACLFLTPTLIVYPARRASDGAIGGNPPARPHVAPIRS